MKFKIVQTAPQQPITNDWHKRGRLFSKYKESLSIL